MTRIITERDIVENFQVTDVISSIEDMFIEFGKGLAATGTREDILTPLSRSIEGVDSVGHLLKTMGGVIPALGVGAVRINSNILSWKTSNGRRTKSKIPNEDGRHTGLVLLFSTETGELLSIFPDGLVQSYRVAATSAIAAKYLARKDSSELGILGVGPQARAHLLAFSDIFEIESVKIYSPTSKNKNAFVERMRNEIDAEIIATETPEEVFTQADIIQCATNSLDPVFEMDWVPEGSHMGVLNGKEPPADFFSKNAFDIFVQSWPKIKMYEEIGTVVNERNIPAKNINYYVAGDPDKIPGLSKSKGEENHHILWEKIPSLHQVISGEIKRDGEMDKTAFYNRGFGTQFAAAGWALFQLAVEKNIGNVVPNKWFEQEIQGT
jgi:alanine dehydrogenase